MISPFLLPLEISHWITSAHSQPQATTQLIQFFNKCLQGKYTPRKRHRQTWVKGSPLQVHPTRSPSAHILRSGPPENARAQLTKSHVASAYSSLGLASKWKKYEPFPLLSKTRGDHAGDKWSCLFINQAHFTQLNCGWQLFLSPSAPRKQLLEEWHTWKGKEGHGMSVKARVRGREGLPKKASRALCLPSTRTQKPPQFPWKTLPPPNTLGAYTVQGHRPKVMPVPDKKWLVQGLAKDMQQQITTIQSWEERKCLLSWKVSS